MKKLFLVLISFICVFSITACSVKDAASIVNISEIFEYASKGSYDLLSNTTKNPAYRLGDINQDGKISNLDLLTLFKYMHNSDAYPLANDLLADVNQDGKITSIDILSLFRYIYSPSTYPIPEIMISNLNNNAYGEAYYIAEGYGMNWRGSGWNVDDRFDLYNTTGYYKLTLDDHSNTEFKSFFRDFDAETKGILRLETIVVVNSSNGAAYIAFENAEGDKIVKLVEKDGYWTLVGKTESIKSKASISSASDKEQYFVIMLEIDLDKNTAFVVIDNEYVGQVDIAGNTSLTRLSYGLEKTGTGSIELNHADLNKNYVLSERFLALSDSADRTPAFWNVEGDFKLVENGSGHYDDRYSMTAVTSAGNKSVATRSFDPIYGKIAFETFVLLPEKTDGASVALTSGGREILKFETVNGKFVMGDVVLHDYIADVWQNLHIDADTETGIAKIYINGKERATVNFTAESFDGVRVEFSPDHTAEMWFDDVVLYNLYDYADYPSYPQVAESTDYNVGVNVCWLWRNQNSTEGWEQASSFPELQPYLGYYDEGLRETADWELKYMAEHGIDFMNICWYSPTDSQTDPLKKMRNSYAALHDGYMYAKYSDLVDFCILWENTHPGAENFDQFKEIVWNYWKEYYFSDSRYLRLDNKAVLTVWNFKTMVNIFGGNSESVKAAIEWMNQELIDMGYGGLILLVAVQGETSAADYATYARYGLDGTFAYHYGTSGSDPQHQINANETNSTNSLNASSHHIPTVSTGFNQIARNDSRYPLITAENHLLVCENITDILDQPQYNTGTWIDNTVMISNWNEYTEGTYIFPCEQNGFTYLENIRKAFTNDTSDHSEIDVKPSEAQVERVTHMYPDNHSPIRWYQTDTNIGQQTIEITINYTTYEPIFNPTATSDGDWEVVGNTNYGKPDKGTNNGFFSMMMVYHEWDRFTGRLTLKTRDERTIVFTVGSDKITVDGKEQNLGYTFTLRDGLPVFRIKSLCDLLGYKYIVEANKIMIQSCTDEAYESLTDMLERRWEFNLAGFTGGWEARFCGIVVGENGTMLFTPTTADPQLIYSTQFNASEYDTLTVGLKYIEGLDYSDSKYYAEFFFKTGDDSSFSREKSIKVNYSSGMQDGDTIYLTFNLSSHTGWTGTVTEIRLDVVHGILLEQEIDYIRFSKSE